MPNILHCADTPYLWAFLRITSTFVRVLAPLAFRQYIYGLNSACVNLCYNNTRHSEEGPFHHDGASF